MDNLCQAIEQNPKDTSLYKMLLISVDEKHKVGTVRTYLKRIVDEDIIIPRSEIEFYVLEALATNQTDSAQLFFR